LRRQRLDAIVPNTLRDDPVALAAWTRARRVQAARGRGEAVEEGAATAPIAQPGAPA
jgi:hypothetical protein